MGYQVVKRYTRRDGSIVWRILYENYSENKKTQWHIPRDGENVGWLDEATRGTNVRRIGNLFEQVSLRTEVLPALLDLS